MRNRQPWYRVAYGLAFWTALGFVSVVLLWLLRQEL